MFIINMIKQNILPRMINFLFGIILFPFGILMYLWYQVHKYFLNRYVKTQLKDLNVFNFHIASKPYSNSIVKSVNMVKINSNLKYYEWSLSYEFKAEQMASILMELDMNYKELTKVLRSLQNNTSFFCHSLNYEFKYNKEGLSFSFTNSDLFFVLPLQLLKNAWEFKV